QIYIGSLGCSTAFKEGLAQIPGVSASSCSSGSALTYDRSSVTFESANGRAVSLRGTPVDYGFFELFGVRPLAGRLFARDRGEDDVLRSGPIGDTAPSMVINESAARALGYTTPNAAVGQYRIWNRIFYDGQKITPTPAQSSQIVGVVPDLAFGSVRTVVEPSVYYIDPAQSVMFV